METTNHNLTLLERARQMKREAEEEQRLKDARQHEESLVSRRRAFGWALARVLELGYDQTQQFPDDSFPGTMEWDSKNKELQYVQDGFIFIPCPYYANDMVLLQGHCARCDGLAHQPMSHLPQLVMLLDSENVWERDYCRARQTEEEEIAAGLDVVVKVKRHAPPPAPEEQRLLDALKEWVDDIITGRLSDHYCECHC